METAANSREGRLRGRRARGLRWLLELAGFDTATPAAPLPSWEGVRAAGLADDVDAIYRKLGGSAPEPPLPPEGWVLGADGVPVELDEELSFNRYRGATLEATSYRLLTGFDRIAYGRWCLDHEAGCRPAGGPDHSRRRAFDDFLRDLTPLTAGVPVARLSIYDTLEVDGRPTQARALLDRIAPDQSAQRAAEAVAGWMAARTFSA